MYNTTNDLIRNVDNVKGQNMHKTAIDIYGLRERAHLKNLEEWLRDFTKRLNEYNAKRIFYEQLPVGNDPILWRQLVEAGEPLRYQWLKLLKEFNLASSRFSPAWHYSFAEKLFPTPPDYPKPPPGYSVGGLLGLKFPEPKIVPAAFRYDIPEQHPAPENLIRELVNLAKKELHRDPRVKIEKPFAMSKTTKMAHFRPASIPPVVPYIAG
jgi:hypothetical protein